MILYLDPNGVIRWNEEVKWTVLVGVIIVSTKSVCIYIYIQREREMYTYIYIHIYMYRDAQKGTCVGYLFSALCLAW